MFRVFFVLLVRVPYRCELVVGGLRRLPHPGQALFVVPPLPRAAAGGGGKAHSPLPKAASLGEEGFFFFYIAQYFCCPPSWEGGYKLILLFFLPGCCKDKLGGGTAPSLPSPLQGEGLLPHQGRP